MKSIIAGGQAVVKTLHGGLLIGAAAGLFPLVAMPAAPLIPFVVAGAVIGAGTSAWNAYKEQQRIKYARQLKGTFGVRAIESNGLLENSESKGYRLTRSYDPPQDTEYLSGVRAALEGGGTDRTGWSEAKFEGYRDCNVIALRTDKKSAKAFEQGCIRCLDEQGQSGTVETPALAAVASSTGGGAAGDIVALRQALLSLVGDTENTRGLLESTLQQVQDLQANYGMMMDSSNSGRDVLEALSGATDAVEIAAYHIGAAASKIKNYIEQLGQ